MYCMPPVRWWTLRGYARKVALMGTYARERKMAVLLANYSGVSGGPISAGCPVV